MDIEQLALKLDAPSPKHIVNRLKWGGYETWESFVTSYTNHKVAAVRKTDRVEKVYDITVKDYHNFALTDCHGNGTVFVHNSEMEACIAGDTLIATPDGYVEIQELAKCYGPDETFIVYSYDHEKKQIVPALGKQARKTVTEMSFKVTFDSGKVLVATPDHRVMRRDGTYCEVQDLKPGDSMMPFYRRDLFADMGSSETSDGYRWIYTMDYEGSTVKNGWVAEHRLIAEWVSGRKVNPDEVVHHINFKKWDNRPENLQIMLAEDHRNYHAKIINSKKWDESNSEWIEGFKKKHSEFMKLNNPAKRSDITFAKILQVCDRDGFNLYTVSRTLDCSFNVISHRLRENGFRSFETFAKAYDKNWQNNGWDNRGEKNPRFDATLTFQHICDAFSGQTSKALANELNTTQIKILNRVKAAGYQSWSDFKENFANHKVVSVEPHEVIDLYDLTVDGYKNYATDSIIVHNTPEIASALDIYSEETAAQGTDGRILHIHSDNRKVQELLEDLFYDTINVEFNLPMWVRNLVKYGDFFLFNDVSPDYGVLNCIPISISEIEREEGFDPSDPMAVRYRWITQGNRVLENWQVTHFRLLGNDAFLPYGSSVLEGARRIWRQLILIEDAMLVYRVIRAPERRVFYIDVGNVPPEEISNYLEQAQSSLKRNEVVDKSTGRVDLRFNPMAVDQDYFLPVRGGESGTKIDTLAGGQNTAAIEDVQYIQKKLFAALKIPKAYLGYDEETGCFTGDTRISLLDGREVEIERLASEHAEGKQNWVYSFDSDGKPHVGKVLNAWETKRVNELYVVTLDNGEEIRCTGNHRFMMRDGSYVRADELEPGTSCMTFCKESEASAKNHKVLSVNVIVLEEPVPVYDLEIEKWSNFTLSAGVVVHNSKATLAQEDIRFSRSIQRIQKTVISELNKLAMIHLYSHGYEGEDLMDFTLKLSNPSSIAQQQKLELISTKFDIAGKAPEGLVSRQWIRKNILELTDQEIEQLKEQREDDKLEDAAVEKAGAEEDGAEGGPGGEGGAGEGGEETEGEGDLGGLFAGDRPRGELLTALPGDGDKEDDDEGDIEEEEFIPPSIDDLDAPVKLSNRIDRAGKNLNMFGEPIKKSRKQTRGPASTGMHDFGKMTGLGNTQSTLRDPYQKNWLRNPLGFGEGTGRSGDVGDAMRTLASMTKSNKFASPKILRETGTKNPEDDAVLDVDLNSLKSEFEK